MVHQRTAIHNQQSVGGADVMKRIAFAYYGGKFGLCNDIIDLMPEHDHYIEAFAGSYVVGLNKPMSPIETLNDKNGDITNFFEVLRTQPEKLIHLLELTPYARSEFENAWQEDVFEPVEKARRFYLRVSMDIAKAGQKRDKSWSKNIKYKQSEFSYAPFNFYNKIEGLKEVANRIRNIQVENGCAFKIIEKYDSRSSLFYLDPPYMPKTRTSKNDYLNEMGIDGHSQLANILNKIKGRAIVSGYDSPEYRHWYRNWWQTSFPPKMVAMSKGKGRITQEMIWTNFDPAIEIKKQLCLFS